MSPTGSTPSTSRPLVADVDGALAVWLDIRRDPHPLVAHRGTLHHVQARLVLQTRRPVSVSPATMRSRDSACRAEQLTMETARTMGLAVNEEWTAGARIMGGGFGAVPDELIRRWADWQAQAATGQLARPSRMPEREPQGSCRR
ncbi:hypothetical protein [Streptomyces sp. TRM75563]|uniref:hypothetical protein n=1 Tax=Streptomyces sp. TRM75563 TaxID=2817418 RepID=UPI001F6080C1|nr:hypothetical protein [Streptomyces sp. TRM75563]MCI4042422.1 hypothetical protein [Streptomyces sp. TRM75563]